MYKYRKQARMDPCRFSCSAVLSLAGLDGLDKTDTGAMPPCNEALGMQGISTPLGAKCLAS